MRITLTTDHPSSSYGQPVLLLGSDRTPYGAMDDTPQGPARMLVLAWARDAARAPEERTAAMKFLRLAWMAPAEAAEAVGLSRAALKHHLDTGTVPSRLSGSTRLICGADLVEFSPRRGRPARKER